MCGRYNITKKLETIEKELDIEILEKELFDNLVNISPGNIAPVLTFQQPKSACWMTFGLTPSWAKKKMYVINARAEGDHNTENNPDYTGAKGIIQKPMFRKAIRSQRCLVIATNFIEGPADAKLSKPYLVFRNDFQSFTFGGIWDRWINSETGEVFDSFAIITTAPCSITQELGHHRAPLIIDAEWRAMWLNPDTNFENITALLHPIEGKDYNAFPINPAIKNPRNKNIDDLKPIAPALRKQTQYDIVQQIELLGMGESPARNRKNERR